MNEKYSADARVWCLSDLHFGHDKEFVWKARGFNNIQEMNETIIKNIKSAVRDDDIVYLLGDLALGQNEREWLEQIPGHVHIILGNHDTDRRIELYQQLGWEVAFADRIKYGKQSIYLSHYPTMAGGDAEKLSISVLTLSGHTHSKEKWTAAQPLLYNVACDANNCTPVLLSDIIAYVREQLLQLKGE